jgi:nicotinamidase-related amidase
MESLWAHITLIKDATAAFSHENMHAAHEVNGPLLAHAFLTTEKLLALLPTAQEMKR